MIDVMEEVAVLNVEVLNGKNQSREDAHLAVVSAAVARAVVNEEHYETHLNWIMFVYGLASQYLIGQEEGMWNPRGRVSVPHLQVHQFHMYASHQ